MFFNVKLHNWYICCILITFTAYSRTFSFAFVHSLVLQLNPVFMHMQPIVPRSTLSMFIIFSSLKFTTHFTRSSCGVMQIARDRVNAVGDGRGWLEREWTRALLNKKTQAEHNSMAERTLVSKRIESTICFWWLLDNKKKERRKAQAASSTFHYEYNKGKLAFKLWK